MTVRAWPRTASQRRLWSRRRNEREARRLMSAQLISGAWKRPATFRRILGSHPVGNNDPEAMQNEGSLVAKRLLWLAGFAALGAGGSAAVCACASCGCTLSSDAATGYSALPGLRLT